MDIINIKFDQSEAEIGSLGMQGENKKVALHIDCSSVLEKHPGAAILVNYDPRLPGEPYFNLPVTALENGIYEAVLTPMELACDGLKRIQVRAVEGDYEDRSKTFIAYVEKSVYDFRPPAGPVSDWLDQLRDALAKADAAQQHGPVIGTNGNWYVWKTGAYVDTGVKAEGKDGATGAAGKDGYSPVLTVTEIAGGRRITITDANGTKTFDVLNGENATDEQVREAVDDYMAENPASGGVTDEQIAEAVENYLTANPLEESDPTVPAWAKAESKPSYSYNELTDKPTIPAAYTLPVANASTLGGVKPISKTDDMTQGVGVDSEGKLWALPGGGESSGGGSGGIPTVNTEGTSTAFTATIPEITELYHGLTIDVIFHTRNTSDSTTLNLNGYGDKYIYARQVSKSANAMVGIKKSFITAHMKLRLMYYAGYDRWVCDSYVETLVTGGGTGRNTLASGSYLVGNGTELVNLKTPAQVLADILPSTAADAGKVPTVQENGTIALAEISGGSGGESYALEEAALASGTIATGETARVMTGVTIGMLRQYKMFYLYFGATSNKQLSNGYIHYTVNSNVRRSLLRVNGNRASSIIYHFLDTEKTILLPYAGGMGNVGVAGTFVANASSYGVGSPGTLLPDAIHVLTDADDSAELYIDPPTTFDVDLQWAIKGVLK